MYIYKSNWISRPDTLNSFSPQTLPPSSVVAYLISNQKWNEDMINQHFMKEDAEKILRIPLTSSP